jgi:hypothetical protein
MVSPEQRTVPASFMMGTALRCWTESQFGVGDFLDSVPDSLIVPAVGVFNSFSGMPGKAVDNVFNAHLVSPGRECMQHGEEAHGAASTRHAGFDRFRDGARLHGYERCLRAGRRSRVRRDHPPGPRTGDQLRRFDDLPPDDWRRHRPRFQGANFQKNLELVDRVKQIATTKEVTPAQLALAWLMAQEGVVPIPGTKRRKNLEQNVAALGIALTREDLERIDEAAPKGAASGERYEDMSVVDR